MKSLVSLIIPSTKRTDTEQSAILRSLELNELELTEYYTLPVALVSRNPYRSGR